MVKMFVEPTQERDRCCKLLTKLESSLATLYKIIFTKFSNKYLKRRSSMSPDFLKLHTHFQKKKYPDKIVSKFKRQFVMSVILCRQMLNWIWNSANLCCSWILQKRRYANRGEYSSSTQYTIYFTVPVALRIANLNSTS